MTLDELRAERPAIAALLVEACGERLALAAHLVEQIAALATAKATAAERERVCAHLTLAERGDMQTAIAAIESGAGLEADICDRHMRAAIARTTTPLSLVPSTGNTGAKT